MRKYNKKLRINLNNLGFGLMRLPMNDDGWFDKDVFELIDMSMDKGLNYYDTGFYYLKEKSEKLVREALVKRYSRDDFYIADKLPVWDCNSQDDMENIFNKQLDRLGVDQIDFYLLHALHYRRWEKIYELGVLDFLEKKKKEGRIRFVGFSVHDTAEHMRTIINKYNWDFVQIQLNYYDWKVLHTEDNYKLLEENEIPCITMETLGGGRLVRLPEDAKRVFNEVHNNWTSAEWALRFVLSLPNVIVALSGMDSVDQLKNNVITSDEDFRLSEKEINAISEVTSILADRDSIPCTSCRYCVDACPSKIDIPQVFKAYNDYKIFENIQYFDIAYNLLAGFPRAEDCVGCGNCKKNCPQFIDIPVKMKSIFFVSLCRELEIDEGVLDVDFSKTVLICFGCGDYGRRAMKILRNMNIREVLYADNNPLRWNSVFEGCKVISPKDIDEISRNYTVKILITSKKYKREIYEQLIESGIDKKLVLNLKK